MNSAPAATLRATAIPSEASNTSLAVPKRSKSNLTSSDKGSGSNSRSTSMLAADRRRTRSKNEELSFQEEPEEMAIAPLPSERFGPLPSERFGPRPSAPFAKQSEGLGETGFGERTPMGPKPSDNFRLVKAKSGLSLRSLHSRMSHQESEFDAIDPQEPVPGHWDLNQTGVIPVAVFLGLWTACACVVLFAMVYIYRFQEVLKSYQLAEESALAHAQLVATDLLLPAVAAVDAIQAALAGSVLRDLSDYSTVLRILRPHFEGRHILEEVELAAPPESGESGSVLVKRIGQQVKLLTDREDCQEVPGMRGCAPRGLSASTDEWYKEGYGVGKPWGHIPPDQFWSGPVFIREDMDLAVCPELCWRPAFMFVKRASINGGPKAVITGIPEVQSNQTSNLPGLLVKVVVSASLFKDVLSTASSLSRGEAMVATASGDVVAAEDMASAVSIDEDSGRLVVGKVREARLSWAGAVTDQLLLGKPGIYTESGAYSVTVRRLDGPMDLGESLRLVMGTPIFSFMDPTLFMLTWPSCGVCAAPIAALTSGVLWACLRRRRQKEAPAARARSVISSSPSSKMAGEAPTPESPASRGTTRERFAASGHNRTHLENRRTSLTAALGMKDLRKRLTKRQKTIELHSSADEPAEAPQDMVQMSEVT
ncbi:unnamed protein product [Effrenium voratum]|uniref:Uncharacterized protein n=1 Tax=Effrenium voratum TaxID=2562239 RepID=A0AA36MU33_9DINO|nr:unnamed protein product [Effrenium voratum]CAJ1438898.1 unnamed protein product [Effrenium voratum]